MTDRRRKRKTTNSSTDDTVKDFHAVDPVQPRRRSDCSDHDGGIRHESWMAKVSLAMSSRIFSGGKKLSGSRSTQVMPIGAAVSDNSKTSIGRMSSSSRSAAHEEESQQKSGPFGGLQTLRLVASEKTLGSAIDTSAPVCPSVTCDVASDDSDDDGKAQRGSSQGSTSRRGQSQRRATSRSQPVVQKVRPGDHDDAEEEDMIISSIRARTTSIPTGTRHTRDARDDSDAETNVQDAAPILKGFFSKTVSISNEQRQKQRQQRRESVYRESKLRQNKLREHSERERAADEELNRRRRVEQLRRLNQQRRIELLRDAAGARKNLFECIQEDNEVYLAERERWEIDFGDEMRVLSAAFRKSRTSDENRPMTVAGLAVPEAISQLERDASNFEKRVKTAQPALSGMSSHQRRSERPSTTASSFDTGISSPSFFDSCDVLPLEDSKDVFDLFGGDDQANGLFPSSDSVVADNAEQPDLDLNRLLEEREKLLQRIAVIDRMVQTRVVVATVGARTD
ncbi:hypothetical protein PF005_g11334 [Phytophthora fragariae]|uniref:Uncharacterized protein n=1 Tax=Phytophthora fragariae TaxID=53985 RepID=A0A6A3U380_9STRA|nr:hypothetical protein PF003_g1715 [Phytophthora fragariae]KAE8940786.1 hypothetical protein PF009_g9414 [Phytophthora fragariae]KAE9111295.1 hypothetical protein PF007_g11543 [Phytophthora fragariae]KAE9144434.1 hypothetical protein PF006_g10643 [Phytophthora fragariae]KAE9210644.1 hypothetical protein PF005_g11334 [Phytophthora fragariae]